MQPSTSIDLGKTLEDLAESSFDFRRREAAQALGTIPATSEEILRALLTAEALDSHPSVRSAAAQSLQAPVHQAYLETHPDFRREEVAQAEQERKERQMTEEESIIATFLDRRRRERGRVIVIPLGMILVLAIFLLPFDLVEPAYRIGIVIVFLWWGAMLLWSWADWRCPACDSWLGAPNAHFNPWSASPALRCPYCGSKLLM